ncbi:restriction endonuclease subunit S [Ruminobacter sp.]|uniref:restriction endonuclease subunit S n=1 Tax=Ruminobacter sp. TaxID=2774296 RepID=UPI00386476AA
MERIDTSRWKEFRVGDLFDVSRPVARSQAKYKEGKIPFVASGNYNNGVVKWCEPTKDDVLDQKGCITLSPLDGSAFYQPVDFLGRGGAGSAILLLRNESMTEMSGLFISAVLRAALTKFSYNDQINSQNILVQKIKLPSTAGGKPDFAYMESYMRKIIEESEACLENLRRADKSKTIVKTEEWKDFKVGDLFEKLQLGIKNPNFNKALDVSEVRTAEFNLPLVNAKHGNNGIMYYGREEDFETAEMTIDIVQNGAIATGDVYAQPKKTGVLWDAYLVRPLFNISSEYALMFLATVIEKAIKDKFSYDDKCVWDKASQLYVKLPVSKEGKPDIDYMENYMSEILKNTAVSLKMLTRVTCR